MESTAAGEGAALRHRLVNAARLEALRQTRASQETIFAAAHSQLRERLREARSRPDYAALFAALLAEAQAALPGATVIRIDPLDAALAPHAESTLDTWGGVELEAADGRIVRNTLEERLRRAEPELRRLAAHALGLA
jgi:vacuolar-type H+-ATPase subunit E/Vma4